MALSLNYTVLGTKYADLMRRRAERVRPAALEAMDQVRDEILVKGRENISRAGNFGSRWTEGFKGKVVETSPGEFELTFTHDVDYFSVFQRGAIIRGKPLLWIPLSFATEAKGVLARNFSGGLFRVDRKSGKAPLLLSLVDKQPKYFAKEQVRIPKKFRVLEIIKEVSKKTKTYFLRRLRSNGR